jgi:molecular chaperone GrpE (heat shock protein)
MDAVTCAPGKKDVVIKELEKGYSLNDKVIRPAKVIVGGGEEASKEE